MKLERTCMACRCKFEKGNLLRIVKEPNGKISIDESHKVNGRGMYICKNKESIPLLLSLTTISIVEKNPIPKRIGINKIVNFKTNDFNYNISFI